MDARSQSTPGRSFEDFEPLSDWIRLAGSDTLILTLPGFKKEHLRVNLDNNRNLRISGERPLGNNRSSRFYKEVQIPENCDVKDLRARIENGTLYITMPKTISWESVSEQPAPTKDSPPSQDTSKTKDSEKYPTDEQMKPTSTTTSDVTKKEATSTEAEKQMNGSKGAATATTDETKKKEEEERKDKTRKTSEGSTEMEANGGLLKENYMHGGGLLLLGLDESRQLVVNVVVGLLVMLALLVYILKKITP
ncbi:hypothetical protein MRB53_024203 [Persea americana]|uniref:Uncharacterized protein n=1 Tax=Persea americana TaxID=3435 RepID=A0ACC2LC16_PERAE|nr:hypothetical protein MRB53_024203 [Persea americana]